MSDQQRVLSVTQLNEYIKMLLEGSPILSNISVKGEISNFVNHRTGHFYFSLKDEGGVVRAVMFKGSASKLKFVPENGMKVVARGRVSSFVRDGQYQLYCEDMEPDGIGALYIAYEQLKRKLEEEGLFSESRKRPLPKIPTRVGIITSPTGAAVRDMINITARRFPYAELVLYPSLVQGESAAKNLIAGVEYFNKTRRVDVIIIGRGGGSIEDLWAFNDEALARTVAASAIPVISAVGHETDFTICDFASDRRAPTPSAAAELAVPDTAELKRKINNVTARMELLLSKAIEIRRTNLKQASQRRVLQSPGAVIDDKRMALLSLDNRMTAAEKLIVGASRNRFVALTAKLEALNPMSVVTRGYSAVFLDDGALLKSVSQVNTGDKFSLRVSDGEISGVVTEKKFLEK